MASQSMRAVETSAPTASAGASDGRARTGRGNADAADRVEAEATSRPPADYAVRGAPVEHAAVEPSGAVNAADTPSTERRAGEREVRILRTQDDPLRVAEATPAEAQLYEERPLGEVCDPAWQAVVGVRGSVEAPSRTEHFVDRPLFVGGAPSVMDVHQGQVGDCYLMAGLIGLVAAEPGRIADMIQVSGQSAIVSFFRHDAAADAWIPTAITVDLDLAHRTDPEGGRAQLNGAGFRRSEQPVQSDWYAQESFDDLWVCEDAYYEAAMWVPLVEKAYARFAERFGQYGGFLPRRANTATDAQGNPRSGYEIVEGGFTKPVMRVLLGGEMDTLSTEDVEWSPGQPNVSANELAVRRLLHQRGDGAVSGERSVMTVSMTEQASIERLDAQLSAVLEKPDVLQYPDFERALRRLQATLARWSSASSEDQQELQARLVKESRGMAAPSTWPILQSSRGEGEYRALNELLLVVANLGDDEGRGQRHVYARHEYVVMGSTFRDASGAVLDVTDANLTDTLPRIEPTASEVQLRNPHGGNSPDAKGTRDPARDDGAFGLTLAQFFRSFDTQQSVVLK